MTAKRQKRKRKTTRKHGGNFKIIIKDLKVKLAKYQPRARVGKPCWILEILSPILVFIRILFLSVLLFRFNNLVLHFSTLLALFLTLTEERNLISEFGDDLPRKGQEKGKAEEKNKKKYGEVSFVFFSVASLCPPHSFVIYNARSKLWFFLARFALATDDLNDSRGPPPGLSHVNHRLKWPRSPKTQLQKNMNPWSRRHCNKRRVT